MRRWDLYAARDELYLDDDTLLFGDVLGIGFGHTVFVVPLRGGEPQVLSLRSYFVRFHRSGDAVYVASGEDVTRLDLRGGRLDESAARGRWDRDRVNWTPEYIEGLAEHDPPGGWRPFRIRAADGEAA